VRKNRELILGEKVVERQGVLPKHDAIGGYGLTKKGESFLIPLLIPNSEDKRRKNYFYARAREHSYGKQRCASPGRKRRTAKKCDTAPFDGHLHGWDYAGGEVTGSVVRKPRRTVKKKQYLRAVQRKKKNGEGCCFIRKLPPSKTQKIRTRKKLGILRG